MLNSSKIEKLKDILIDHVFDYGYNEVVQKVESPGINVTFDDPSQLQDPVTKSLIESAVKTGNFKAFYTTREKKYCKILLGENTVHRSLIIKLETLGYKKGKKLHGDIEKAQEQLVARSFLVRNNPIKEEVRLTEKGLKHYLEGKSFEDDYIQRRNSDIALVISVVSFFVALAAFIKQ